MGEGGGGGGGGRGGGGGGGGGAGTVRAQVMAPRAVAVTLPRISE